MKTTRQDNTYGHDDDTYKLDLYERRPTQRQRCSLTEQHVSIEDESSLLYFPKEILETIFVFLPNNSLIPRIFKSFICKRLTELLEVKNFLIKNSLKFFFR